VSPSPSRDRGEGDVVAPEGEQAVQGAHRVGVRGWDTEDRDVDRRVALQGRRAERLQQRWRRARHGGGPSGHRALAQGGEGGEAGVFAQRTHGRARGVEGRGEVAGEAVGGDRVGADGRGRDGAPGVRVGVGEGAGEGDQRGEVRGGAREAEREGVRHGPKWAWAPS
jgi:hypothetical protein